MQNSFPILIADDDFISRELLKKSLITKGHEVTTAKNGREALEKFNESFYPIIISDWIMPEMDGMELCRAIRENGSEDYVFIILLSAKDSHDNILSGFEAGADDYLTKPFHYSELYARINTGIRVLELEKSLKNADKQIRQYAENLEEMVEERTEALRKSEEKYRMILSNIEDGYYESDLAGNLTFFNESLCRVLGYPWKELMSMNSRDFTDKAHAKKVYQQFNLVYKTGIPARRIDWEVISRDGTKRHMDSSVSLIKNEEGKPVGFRGIVRDMTERKELEQELIKERMIAEESSRAKSEFLANMSHEIRTPLNGIMGMVELALETETDGYKKNILNTINSEANILLSHINNVLDFSKIEAKKLQLDETPFDLQIMMEHIANSTKLRAKQKGLESGLTVDPDVPHLLIGDPGRLRQIITNLTTNALKFTHKGSVLIHVEVFDEDEEKVKLRFRIKDTGIGIPKEKQGTIFESFTQAGGSTTRKYGGTGLGTTIAKQLAEYMDGEIGVVSKEGEGSTFWFTAQLSRQLGLQPLPSIKEIMMKELHSLIIRDESEQKPIFIKNLISIGCAPIEAYNNEEVFDSLHKSISSNKPFDLIFLQIHMSETDGYKLARKIRKKKKFKDIPIIAFSHYGIRGDAQKCKEVGIQCYLTGFIKCEDLKKAIQLVLRFSGIDGLNETPKLITKHTVAEIYRKGVNLLIVEDYPTNQQVALKHLQGAGYQVDLAENGHEAVEAFKKNKYNLILMDIQMPMMDGYEATKSIRAIEMEREKDSPSGVERIPIIAMTAHALKGDKAKCLRAGMDDYITKPLRRLEILAIVDKWATSSGEPEMPCEDQIVDNNKKSGYNSPAPIDMKKAIEEFEGDKAFFKEVFEGFLENCRNQLKTIQKAVSNGDAETVRKEAHAIKGGAANLTADDFSEIAFELENIGKSGMLGNCDEVLERLENGFKQLENLYERERITCAEGV